MMIALKWIVGILAIIAQDSLCLRVVEVIVPGYRVRGETALLQCQYELERDTLYSVKWYKDNEEFYRYMPKFSPPQHSYRVEGVKIDHHISDDMRVNMKGLTLKSSGVYRCEVSAEAPSFSSASGEGRLEVVYLPKDGPYISETEREYQAGDVLSLNCTSGKSYPASALFWYVNDEMVTDPVSLVDYGVSRGPHGLEATTLGLRLEVSRSHTRLGVLRVRCVASTPWPVQAPGAPGRAAPLTDNREALLLVKSGSSPTHLSTTVLLMLPVTLYYVYDIYLHMTEIS